MRHPLTLLTDEVPGIRLEPGRSCLILQDVHNPLADARDGWLARKAAEKVLSREFDEYFETLRLVAGNFRVLAEACRAAGIAVTYVSLGLPLNGHPSAFQKATEWIWDVDGLGWGFSDDWHPNTRDHIFVKQGWGALSSPAFRAFLSEHQIQSAIVAGTFYDFGIRQTCYELTDLGVSSLVASDAVVALTHAGQSHTSGNIAHGLTKLRSTAEILDLLKVMESVGYVLV
jgi:nicotinamidase-related amidase